MPKLRDLIGKRFGRLLVLSLSYTDKQAYWFCRCDCGNNKTVAAYSLGRFTKSCGCFGKDNPSRFVHGDHKSTEYKTWSRIKRRCLNKNDPDYIDYGGRGITICDRWMQSYKNFLDDMGRKPSKSHSIERVDVNAGYSPDNCKWATDLEQARNKRTSINIEFKGETKPLKEWCTILGLKYTIVYQRIKVRNWPINLALTHVPSELEIRKKSS